MKRAVSASFHTHHPNEAKKWSRNTLDMGSTKTVILLLNRLSFRPNMSIYIMSIYMKISLFSYDMGIDQL